MANRLLRSIAVQIGEGLAKSLNPSRPAPKRRQAPNLSPILTRIEEIESRVARVELSPVPSPSPEEIQALGTLLSSQSDDIAGLRLAIDRIESRNSAQAEAFAQKVALVELSVPATVEANVALRIMDLEQKLRGEFQEIHHKTVDAFVATIENRVVGRITAIESRLAEQSRSIVALREKTLRTDDHLQRLVDAVEKLCVQAEVHVHAAAAGATAAATPPAAPPAPEPPPQNSLKNLQSHYDRMWQAVAGPAGVEPEPEPAPVFASDAPSRYIPSPRRSMKTVGVAILGLAVLGFRLFR